jgi:fatty acid desaturase
MENQNQNPEQRNEQNSGPYPYQNYTPHYNVTKNRSVVSIGDWIVTFILMAIPLVNIIMLFVWAFGGGAPESKANWAKANLILYLVVIILVICFWSFIATIIGLSALGR